MPNQGLGFRVSLSLSLPLHPEGLGGFRVSTSRTPAYTLTGEQKSPSLSKPTMSRPLDP